MEDILLVHRKSSKNFAESLQDSAVWKTCLRQILFCREDEVNNFLEVLEPEDKILRGEEGLSLLLEILCGLHSPIVGETEVFGQFRQFVDSRKTLNDTLFADNQKWLNFIMAEVKRTRAEHLVGIGSQSYGSLLRRYSKDMDSVTICGSGQLAQEILPWVAHKRTVQVLCRECTKMRSFAEKFDNLSIVNYNEAYVHGEAMVIAAPLSDARILELIAKQDTRPVVIYDLRGEENNLPALIQEKFPRVTLMTLQQFFAEIEETKKDRQTKIQQIKEYLMEKALAFAQRTELRPLGWDDICA
ncbi:MAG: hypothetical protein ACKOX6_13055 [Bdellovibrio sp.]